MADKDGNKTGGRIKGSVNKTQSSTKAFLRQLIEDEQDKIQTELGKLEGKPYLDAINNLMPYTEPKLSSVTSDIKIDSPKLNLIVKKLSFIARLHCSNKSYLLISRSAITSYLIPILIIFPSKMSIVSLIIR